MSNPALLSNESSPLKQMLISTSEWDAFSYSVRSNAPNMSRQRIDVAATSGAAPYFDETCTFTIPRYGLWGGAALRITVTVKKDANLRYANWLGPCLCKEVSLNTHNKVIQQIYAQNIIQEAVYGRENNYRQTQGYLMGENHPYLGTEFVQKVGVSTAREQDITMIVPLPICFMDSTSSFLDTSFVETLNLTVKVPAQAEVCYAKNKATATATSESTSFKIKKIDLICDFIGVTDATRKALQTSNYSVERPLTQLNYSYFKETAKTISVLTTDTESTEHSIPIKCNGLCSHTMWRIVPRQMLKSGETSGNYTTDSYDFRNPGHSAGGPVPDLSKQKDNYQPGWEKVEIKASGTVLFSMKWEELLYGFGGGYARGLSGSSVSGATTTAATGGGSVLSTSLDGMNTICWGLDARSTGGAYDSGSQSFKELVDAQLVVTMSKGSTTHDMTYFLEVFHKVYALNSISSSDGRITQSISV